jgi:hypothetical protein
MNDVSWLTDRTDLRAILANTTVPVSSALDTGPFQYEVCCETCLSSHVMDARLIDDVRAIYRNHVAQGHTVVLTAHLAIVVAMTDE